MQSYMQMEFAGLEFEGAQRQRTSYFSFSSDEGLCGCTLYLRPHYNICDAMEKRIYRYVCVEAKGRALKLLRHIVEPAGGAQENRLRARTCPLSAGQPLPSTPSFAAFLLIFKFIIVIIHLICINRSDFIALIYCRISLTIYMF